VLLISQRYNSYAGRKSLKASFYIAAEKSIILTNFKLIIIILL